ncbi:TetR/AcrR family transcriptional regulator [Variovorax ginsengisoli]|uniref:Helix-turn-helix domain-containing protein n=1 Tax=Variovorax ginsengisoli TaxID=363844 RepID=A0ABT8S6R0_9BURK|nr:TetR/AcrR family transcriptional regulator [Variovorax ginsengisoli]MDN8615440.1 helix-turn-helix domain-containing protein [Variovorax ginsengisoli]MDO1534610.1 helix-turn-helix domain-containing protein [Variovorax ginsengisoli]
MSGACSEKAGRPNQRRRTRKDLLQAAARLMQEGRQPSLEEVAEAAAVSRATAYRYFPSIEALHREASLDIAVPEAAAVLGDTRSHDPVQRLELVDAALSGMIAANEASLRMLLAQSMERVVRGGHDAKVPARQNRRSPLIEAALAPARSQFRPAAVKTLEQALALVIGTESMVVCKDVLQLDDAQASKVRRWAIRALVAAARKPD